jgi:hypothetical protein
MPDGLFERTRITERRPLHHFSGRHVIRMLYVADNGQPTILGVTRLEREWEETPCATWRLKKGRT